MFRIRKILNNNAVVVLSEKGLETVVTGNGIAYQKKVGDTVPKAAVEKVFTLAGKETNSRFQELVKEIPIEHILLSESITRYAKMDLGKRLSDVIYITLTDHFSAAVERYQDGVILKNPMLWDVKQFYHDEFAIGEKAVAMVRSELGVTFLEDEAAFIALHFVNAQLNEDMGFVHEMTKMIQEISGIVREHFQIEYNAQSLAYYRFINHLKFFAQRLFRGAGYADDDTGLFDMIKGASINLANPVHPSFACNIRPTPDRHISLM